MTTTGMNFSQTLDALKLGYRLARRGWNGKAMYIYLVPENRYAPTTPAGHAIARNHEDGLVPYGAYLAMKTAQDNVVPWLASQTDILAEDWELVPAEQITQSDPRMMAPTDPQEIPAIAQDWFGVVEHVTPSVPADETHGDCC